MKAIELVDNAKIVLKETLKEYPKKEWLKSDLMTYVASTNRSLTPRIISYAITELINEKYLLPVTINEFKVNPKKQFDNEEFEDLTNSYLIKAQSGLENLRQTLYNAAQNTGDYHDVNKDKIRQLDKIVKELQVLEV